MEDILPQFEDWLHDTSRELDREEEELTKKAEQIKGCRNALEIAQNLFSENMCLQGEISDLRQQLQEEKEARANVEMQLNEMNKLSANVVKKSSQDEVLKAVRTFVNKSKQKTTKKRTLIKEMVLEFTYANGIVLPADLMALVYALDDEQEVPKIVIEKAEDVIAYGGVKNVKTGTDD